jgi:hypothetical protein
MLHGFRRSVAVAVAGSILSLVVASSALAGPAGLPFKSAGSGTETSLGPVGCQFGGICMVQITGTATSSHMGTGPYTSTLAINYGDLTIPSPGEYCAYTTGTGTITAANGDTLNQTDTGWVCGGDQPNASHTFTGTYSNTGGTGRFATATGGGTITGGDDGYGNSYYQETGTITY